MKREGDGHERLSMAKQPVTCGVCKNKIVDGKDEALYCEGRCQSWMHRYCAGVSKIQFEELGRSEDISYECDYIEHRQNGHRVSIPLLYYLRH